MDSWIESVNLAILVSEPNPSQSLMSLLQQAQEHIYQKESSLVRDLALSMAYGRQVNIAPVADVEPEMRSRIQSVLNAYFEGKLQRDDVRQSYLEFFPEPDEQS